LKFLNITALLFLCSCSLIQIRTTYQLDKNKEGLSPVCTHWDDANGSAFFQNGNDFMVHIKVYSSGKSLLFGPLLIPIIPSVILKPGYDDNKISSYLSLNVVPLNGRKVSVALSDQELYFDDEKIDFGNIVTYSRKTDRKGERAQGIIDLKESDHFTSERAFSLSYHGKRFDAPKTMSVIVKIKTDLGETKKKISLKRSYEWDYIPIWVPTQHTDKRCKVGLPEAKRSLFL
jgi:hypothetical protein